jgi:hypothetical protein
MDRRLPVHQVRSWGWAFPTGARLVFSRGSDDRLPHEALGLCFIAILGEAYGIDQSHEDDFSRSGKYCRPVSRSPKAITDSIGPHSDEETVLQMQKVGLWLSSAAV